MRPYVVLRYCTAEAWTHGPAAIAAGPTLENASAVAAYDVEVSGLVIDGESFHRFQRISPLGSHEARALEPGASPQACALTKTISRSVVKRVLAGLSPVTRWPLRITYRNDRGDAFATCCAILVVRLPLEICSTVVPCPEDASGKSAIGR